MIYILRGHHPLNGSIFLYRSLAEIALRDLVRLWPEYDGLVEIEEA